MSTKQKEMLIRHDEQLKALAQLPTAVQELTTQLRVANARASTVAACVGVVGSVLGCVGTWVVMIRFGK